MRTALYRLLAADGTLLYVGITCKLGRRFSQHRHEKPWWSQVAGVMLSYYDSQAEAEEAETAAIRSENPLHNIRSTPRHGETVSAARKKREAVHDSSWAALTAKWAQEWDEDLLRAVSRKQ